MQLLTREQAECVMAKYWELLNQEENKHLDVKDVNISPVKEKCIVGIVQKGVDEVQDLEQFCLKNDIEFDISSCL